MLIRKRIGQNKHVEQYDLTNHKGRIFFATDIHGNFDALHEELRSVGFDSTNGDLLFNGGDVTDRGADSKYVLDYITEPWFISVAGNHCEMFIEGFESGWNEANRSVKCLKQHGGDWIWEMSEDELKMIYYCFKEMPIGIELELPNNRRIGIVHAEVPYNDWNKFVCMSQIEFEYDGRATAQWSRRWYASKHNGVVKGVDYVLVGHTPTDSGDVELLGNMLFADGGSYINDKINLIELDNKFLGELDAYRATIASW